MERKASLNLGEETFVDQFFLRALESKTVQKKIIITFIENLNSKSVDRSEKYDFFVIICVYIKGEENLNKGQVNERKAQGKICCWIKIKFRL